MSGIIVPTGPSVQPVFTGHAPVRKLLERSPTSIDPSRRIIRAAAGLHAPLGALIPAVAEPVVSKPAAATSRASTRSRGWVTKAWIAGTIIGFVVLALQMSLTAAYAGRFLPGVTVAGQNLGSLTRPQAQRLLTAKVASVRVQFKVGTVSYNLAPSAVGATYDLSTTLDQAYAVGHHDYLTFMPLALWQARGQSDLALSYDIDQPTYHAFIQEVVARSGQVPVNAGIVVNNGVPTVQSDVSGHALSLSAVSAVVASQLATPGATAPKLEPSVQPARIRAGDLSSAITKAKQLIATPVTITYQGKSFQPTPSQIGAWITFDTSATNQPPGLIPKLDPAAITAYLNTIASQISVSAVAQKVNVQNGVSSVYQQGQNGTALDTTALSTKIAALTPGQAFTIVAPIVSVPFQTQYNNSVALPYNQYIEVNLTTQHLWVYQNHSVIYDSPVTSGATGAGFPTVTGMFSILAKQTDRHLVGYQYGPAYNYDVFVQYWMQFYEGFGLHDASWRSSFGGPDYYYDGSHGCINLPLATAAWLYNWSSVGTPVWVHT